MSRFRNIALIIIVSSLLVLPGIVLAQRARQKGVATPTTCQDNELCNPLAGVANTPQELIGRVINQLMGVVGSIALLMFVYGGLIWMTSSGNPEKVKEGRGILIWSAIGLAVIFFSYGLVRLVLAALGK